MLQAISTMFTSACTLSVGALNTLHDSSREALGPSVGSHKFRPHGIAAARYGSV